MKRVKMFMYGVVALALLYFFSAPMVQAQVLDVTTHQVKLKGSFAGVDDILVPDIEKDVGSETAAVVLRSTGNNPDTGGFDYNINLLSEPLFGNDCAEDTIGTLSTYNSERAAIGTLDIDDFPEIGQTLIGRFFAKVKPTLGKASFKSVSGWSEIEDGSSPDPDAISKKISVKTKEKTPERLGLQCTVQ